MLHVKNNRQIWQCIESSYVTEEGIAVPVYGVHVLYNGKEIGAWEDLSTQRKAVERLCRRLTEAQPEPCHWEEILADYIQELADPLVAVGSK